MFWPGYRETIQADWISRHNVQNTNLVTALRRDLDAGESEVIALAVELNADLLLMDEREGRHQAHRFGLKVLGVVGILLEGKVQKKLVHIRPELDALRQRAGFYIGEALYQSALGLADEQ